MKRFIHSYTSRSAKLPVMYGQNNISRLAHNIWYFSLSVAYLKGLGYPIALHADSFSASVLSFLPYDEIVLSLDDIPDELHPAFWASGKIWALENEGAGCVHIDGDVFIKKESLADSLLYGNHDVVVQCHEDADWYNVQHDLFDREWAFVYEHGWNYNLHGAYNTGVLGINDPKILAEFIRRYKTVGLHLSKTQWEYMNEEYSTHVWDLVLEQHNLYHVATEYGAKVQTLLPKAGLPCLEQADLIGYQHVLGGYKYSDIEMCKQMLASVNPEIYKKTNQICKSLM